MPYQIYAWSEKRKQKSQDNKKVKTKPSSGKRKQKMTA